MTRSTLPQKMPTEHAQRISTSKIGTTLDGRDTGMIMTNRLEGIKKHTPIKLSILLFALLAASSSHSQIYKWVDANGTTHFSERKDATASTRTEELKSRPQPGAAQNIRSSEEYWQEQETKFRQRQIQKRQEQSRATPPVTRPKSLSEGRENGTDASRCALARDVLSGAVRHTNGAVIDKYDRDIAENDVHMFCR